MADYKKDVGGARPDLDVPAGGRDVASPAPPVREGTWKHPACPGSPRAVIQAFGRKVKAYVAGNL